MFETTVLKRGGALRYYNGPMPRQLANLFNSNPPKTEGLTRALFVNRERDIAWGVEKLRSLQESHTILSVHGMTRAGKSHYVKRLLLEIKDLPYEVVEVNANAKATARNLLVEIFFTLWVRLRDIANQCPPEDSRDVFFGALRSVEEVKPLVDGHLAEVKLDQSSGVTWKGEGGITFKAPWMDTSFKESTEVSAREGETRTVKPPSDHDLVEWIRHEADIFSQLVSPGRRVLLYVDDLDLLPRVGAGHDEYERIIQHLKTLAEFESVVVLASVRSQNYVGYEKEFTELIGLPSLDADAHQFIYRRHIELFNEGADIFTPEAVAWLERGTQGRVGIFLQMCHEIYQHFYIREPKLPLPYDVEAVKRYMRWWLAEVSARVGVRVLELVESAVHRGSLEVELPFALKESELVYRMLVPLDDEGTRFGINRCYAEVLRGMPVRAP